MAGFMTQQGINPEFSQVSSLIAQAGGHRVPETMERNGGRKAYGRFELREIPAKICATRAALGCFKFRKQEFLESSKALWIGPFRVPASVLGVLLSSG